MTTTWRPAYANQSCYGQYPLAEQAVVVQQRYVFLLSNYDSYLSKPQVRLLRVDLHTAQVQIVDRGALNLPLAVDPTTQVLTYQKQGQLMAYRLPVAQ